jgi:hypothetical protein
MLQDTDITKLVLVPYTNNELSEKESKKTTLFTTASKQFRISLTKEVKYP